MENAKRIKSAISAIRSKARYRKEDSKTSHVSTVSTYTGYLESSHNNQYLNNRYNLETLAENEEFFTGDEDENEPSNSLDHAD